MEKVNNKKFKALGIAGITLCALCCLLPIAGAIFGFAALASLATHLEKLAIAFLALSAIGFGIYLLKKTKKAKACTTDCTCKPETDTAVR